MIFYKLDPGKLHKYMDSTALQHKTASDTEDPVRKLWGVLGTPSLQLFPGPLWPGVIVPVRVRSMRQIENYYCLIGIFDII